MSLPPVQAPDSVGLGPLASTVFDGGDCFLTNEKGEVSFDAMGSLIQRGVFVPAFSQPMTGGCECSKVGAVPIEEGMTQKTSRKKLFMIPAGTPPDVGPPPGGGAYGVRSPRPHNGQLLPPRVDRLTQLSGTERQGCSWGACRESDGRAAAQPPCACTRTQKVAWRRCYRAQLAAARRP